MTNVASADRNAKRRLQTILSDETYGPKLARLNRTDERQVLRLIEQNRGREARAKILELDEARRVRASTSRRAGAYFKLSPKQRRQHHPKDESPLFWRLYDQKVA